MDVKNKNAENLTDEELKDYIGQINNEQLSGIGYLSLYYSIYDTVLLNEKRDEEDFINLIESKEEKELIEKAFKDLNLMVKDINKFLIDEEYSKESVDKLLSIRRELYEHFILLNSYYRELKFVNEILEHNLMQNLAKAKYKDFYLSDLDLNRFFQDTTDFLIENIDNFDEFNHILGTIIYLAPFRMTKEKFIEIIGDNLRISLKGKPKTVVDNEVENIKHEFNGSLAKGYGIKFDYIFREVESVKKLNIKKMTMAELDEEINKINNIISDVETVINGVVSLGLLTSKLYALYMSKDIIDYKEIDEDNLDLEKENILEDLLEEINFYEEALFKTINLFKEINEEAFYRGVPVDEELHIELEKTRKILAYYNDVFFMKEDVLYPDLENIADNNYIEQTIDNLLQYLNRNIKTMGNLERKIRMRSLLSTLMVPFKSPDEFIKYLKGALDIRLTSKEEIFLSVDNIYYFINSFNKYKVKKDS